jgi:hypothetical protein
MVETVGICQVMWFIMLESAKNRVIGVDPLGQQVPPRVQYGTACLLISIVVGIVTRPGLPRETLALLWYYDYLS